MRLRGSVVALTCGVGGLALDGAEVGFDAIVGTAVGTIGETGATVVAAVAGRVGDAFGNCMHAVPIAMMTIRHPSNNVRGKFIICFEISS